MRLEILLLIDLLIGCLMLRYLRRQDPYKPEPLYRMALFTVFGGVIAIGITLGMVYFLNSMGLYKNPSYLDFFVITGPLEEFSKFAAFLFLMLLLGVKIEEPVD